MKDVSIFHDCFHKGELPTDKSRRNLIATALTGWAASSLEVRPEKFGQCMAKIASELGFSATPENLMKEAEKLEMI